MRRKQLGVSLGALMVVAFILILLALLAMKIAPSYLEFFTIKKAVAALSAERRTASPNEIRKAFDQRAQVDDIATIKGSDLEITKEGADIVINAAYRKEIPLFSNVGLYINFAASSKDQ
jgi:hypothetical protein